MGIISRLFIAFFSLFFDDSPFPLDDHIPVQKPIVPNFLETPVASKMELSFFLTPNFERRWNPAVTSTPKPRRLFFGPEQNLIIPEVVVKVQLPLENYLTNLKAAGCKSFDQAPTKAPVKRMGLRI
jgi:hypothetical protein